MRYMEAWTDKPQRPFRLAVLSLLANMAFALAHGALGVWSGAPWYLVLAAYYAILGVMRFCVLRMRQRPEPPVRFVTRFCGGMLVMLSLVLAQTVFISLLFDRATRHHEIIMISLATYTCCKLTLAIVNVIRARNLPLLRVLRNIACADAAASLVTMQRSMIVTFGGMAAERLFNAMTGGVACLFVLGMGISMLRQKQP